MNNGIKEIVILSGKGGTGKTTLTASFAVLFERVVLADCDVDAADLHLILNPGLAERHEFWSGHEALIRKDLCTGCGICQSLCRFNAIINKGDGFIVDHFACEGCGVCVRFCPEGAVDFRERLCGEWMISETAVGPMAHARLIPSAENSGKLVAVVRKAARDLAEARGISLILVDGPPGIGCPVISSLTGAHAVVVVAEPTLSGEHDAQRVIKLARHFNIPAFLCINKWDINPEVTERLERTAKNDGVTVLGRISYDRAVTVALTSGRTVFEMEGMEFRRSAAEIKSIWKSLKEAIS
ncbi:MAG: ATP-binding protein [Thermodesulforhabdaceae bacterium]|jgi:MinD superfamily P-loop ATPase